MTDPITTLVATYGGLGANSYVDLSYANSFIATRTFASSFWTALNTIQREACLTMATQDIDAFTYVGNRYYHDQFLEFPRELRSRFPWNRTDSTTLSQDVIQVRMKRDVQEATCWQALKIAQNQGQTPFADLAQAGVTSHSRQAGPISETVQLGKGGSASSNSARMDSRAMSLLQPWRVGRRIYRA